MSTPTRALGVGLATVATDGTVLDTWYPLPEVVSEPEEPGTVVVPANELEPSLIDALGPDDARGVEVVAVRTVADLTGPRRRRTTSTCACTCSPTAWSARMAST